MSVTLHSPAGPELLCEESGSHAISVLFPRETDVSDRRQ